MISREELDELNLIEPDFDERLELLGLDRAVLQNIRLLLTDVDGVLTDGCIHFDGSGGEFKTFHVHDGAGLVYWHRMGGISGFLSGRGSAVVQERASELGVQEIHLGHLDKRPIAEEILDRLKLDSSQLAYVGDDLADLPVMDLAGFSVSVPNGRIDVRQRADYVTTVNGGQGAVREVVELLLEAQDKWQDVVSRSGLP